MTHIRPHRLPTDCPLATTCAVEITLHSGVKAAIIAGYLPQPVKEHDKRTFQALARLPRALPHHLLILEGDLQDCWIGSMPKDANVQSLPIFRWEVAETPTFTPPHQPGMDTCIDHHTIWDPRDLANQIGGTIPPSLSPSWTTRGSWGPYLFRSSPRKPPLLHTPGHLGCAHSCSQSRNKT